MAVQRNLAAEQAAVGEFGKKFGRMPSSQSDWDIVHKYAYPTYDSLPDEFKSDFTPDATTVPGAQTPPAGASGTPSPAGTNPPAGTPTGGMPGAQGATGNTSDPNNLANDPQVQADTATEKTAQGQMAAAGNFITGVAPALPDTFTTLQKAIRTKMGYGQAPIGQSQLFQVAGLTGFDTLNQSLQDNATALANHSTTLQNVLGEIGSQWQSQYQAAKDSWDEAYQEYNDASNRISTAQNDLLANERQMQILRLQTQLDNEEENYKVTHDPTSINAAEGSGLKLDANGNWVSGTTGVINSPSGHSYDMSTYNAPGGNDYITSLQNKIVAVGKLNNSNDLDNYISNEMPGSDVTAQDVINAASTYHVGWEEILGLIQKESPGGVSDVATQDNNFGGITWSQDYQDSHPNTSKGTARPADEGGNYVKFATAADGINAIAEQFQNRDTGTSGSQGVAGTTGSPIIDSTAKGYYTAMLPGAGGMTQAAIDEAGMQYALTGVMPSVGLGSTGAAGEKRTAIQNRAAELAQGTSITSNKAQLSALSSSLTQQTKYYNTIQRSYSNAENGFQQVVDAFKHSNINVSDSAIANLTLNEAAKQLSTSDIRAYQAGLAEVQNEYNMVFAKGGMVSNKVRTDVQNVINGDVNMKDLVAIQQELQAQGAIITQGAQTQASTISGQINDILSPSGSAGTGATSDPLNLNSGGSSNDPPNKVIAKYPQYKSQISQPPSAAQNFVSGFNKAVPEVAGMEDISKGVVNQVISDIKSMATLGSEIPNPMSLIDPKHIQSVKTQSINAMNQAVPDTSLKATDTLQKVGKVAGSIGELFIPMGAEDKAMADAGIKSPEILEKVVGAFKNHLSETAIEDYSRALGATTKETKAISKKIVPEMIDRGIMSWTRKGLLKTAEEGVAAAGEAVEKVEDKIVGLPKKAKIHSVSTFIDALEQMKSQFYDINKAGEKVALEPQKIANIEELQKTLKQYGKNISSESLIKARRVWDKTIAEAKGFSGKTLSEGSMLDVKKEATSAIRSVLAKAHPDLNEVNGEYKFWKNVEKVIGSTITRTSSQAGTGLGARLGQVAGTVAGAPSGIAGALVDGQIGKWATKIFESTAWRTASAVVKNGIAKSIQSDDGEKLGSLLLKFAAQHGIRIEGSSAKT